MNWINIETATLDSEAFIGSDPVARATWLCLFRYCAGQENGGVIRACRDWSDRKWQQLARVTKDEVLKPSALWTWRGADLHLWAYPTDKQTEVQTKRERARTNGRLGGRPPANQPPKLDKPTSDTDQKPTSVHSAKAEGNGMEGNGMEGEGNRKVDAAGSPLALELTEPEPPKHSKESDEQWLDTLAASTAYAGIDVRKEFQKMQAWCTVNAKKPSRRRFINWINRAEAPMKASHTPLPRVHY